MASFFASLLWLVYQDVHELKQAGMLMTSISNKDVTMFCERREVYKPVIK